MLRTLYIKNARTWPFMLILSPSIVSNIKNVNFRDISVFVYGNDLRTEKKLWLLFFFYLDFLSRPFKNNRTAGEGREHFFNSSLQLPPASQTDISRATTAES